MPFTSSNDLLAWLSQNLFLNPQQADELRTWLGDNADLHTFCKELLRREWVTPFQMNALLKQGGEPLIVGANRLHSRLGEGAMGQVYRAWNVRLGRMVAVKMLHADHALNAKAMERFRRELRTAGALDHPNIVLIRDADECDRVPYLVMDYFEGIDLSRKMREEGPQPIPLAAEFSRQVALGLQHAYERGVVHRDIKPSNLLVVPTTAGTSVVKILDFGLAKFEREEEGQQPLTQAGRLIGTVDFIAPEQATDARNADIRADIYSLGCTLFYLLTGKAPFAGNDQMEKLTARLNAEPPRLRDHRPDAPAELEAVLYKMMACRASDRFQTPQEVAAALMPFCPSAIPMASPVAAPVVMALPVKSAPVQPDSTAPPVEPIEDEPTGFPFGENAFHETPETREKPRRPSSTVETDEEPASGLHKPLLFGILGVLLLIGLSTTAYYAFFRTEPTIVAPILGTMTIELDSPPDRVWAYGDRKPILVKVNRQGFSGPVTLAVEGCPEWLQCPPIKVAAKKNIGELTALLAFHAEEGPHTIKIVASSPEAQSAFVNYPIEVVRVRQPKTPAPPEKKDDE